MDESLKAINPRIHWQEEDINNARNHKQEHNRDMDHLEKNAVREAVSQIAMLGDAAVGKKRRLMRLRDVPYFGRIDFRENDAEKSQPVYVGIHNFRNEVQKILFITGGPYFQHVLRL